MAAGRGAGEWEGGASFMFRTPVSQDERSCRRTWWCYFHIILTVVDKTEMHQNVDDSQAHVENMDGRGEAFS